MEQDRVFINRPGIISGHYRKTTPKGKGKREEKTLKEERRRKQKAGANRLRPRLLLLRRLLLRSHWVATMRNR